MNCIHLDQIEILDLPEHISGCEDCLATGPDVSVLRDDGEPNTGLRQAACE
jgi:hypothetical protein